MARVMGYGGDKIRETPNPALHSQGYISKTYNPVTAENGNRVVSKYGSKPTLENRCYGC